MFPPADNMEMVWALQKETQKNQTKTKNKNKQQKKAHHSIWT